MKRYSKFKDYMRHSFIQYAVILISFIFIFFVVSMAINFQIFPTRANKYANKNISDFLKNQYSIYYRGVISLSENNSIKEYLKNNKITSDMFEVLYNFSNYQNIKSNFIVFDAKGKIKATNLYGTNIFICENSSYVNDIISKLNQENNKVLSVINKMQYNNGQSSNYTFAKCIMEKDTVLGYLMFQLREKDLNDFVINTDADYVIISDNFDNAIYSSNNSLIDSAGKYTLKINSKNVTYMNKKSYYVSVNNIMPNNIKVITMTSIAMLRQILVFGVAIICFIGFFAILLMIILADKMTNKNISALETLSHAIDKCADENLEYRINLDTFEEFKILYEKFNNMMTKVKYLIEKNKEISDRKRIMEIKHLEGQLNPHFMFNVLETLHYEILLSPNEAAKMLVSFAKLMRYSINYGSNEVELKTDIEYVKNYLMLQKVRYNNRLQYNICIDEELMNYKIPKLIIQPIVENSLVHGMKDSSLLSINIIGKIIGDTIEISIIDDGKGMEEECVQRLINTLKDENAMPEHIGLYNVNRAIKLLYGNEYGLDIYSKCGSGTKVILKMPIVRDDENV